MIIVAGHIVLKAAAAREEFLARSRDAVVGARAAAGCLDFSVAADLVDAARINVFERWASQDALDTFRGSGPDDGLGALVRRYQVAEYVVTRA